jgi:putative ABC transport system permease protein
MMSFLRRVLNLGRSDRLHREIDREMSFHIRERVEELRLQGLSEDEALAQARRQFGNRTYRAEETRDADIVTWLDSFAGDVRYALRAMRRSPAFSIVAVASLAIAIGANTAIYSLIDAVVLRSLPVPHPEELVQVTMSDTDESGYFTNPLWEQVRDRQTGFTAITAFSERNFNAADGGEVRRIRGQMVSGEYFRVFGSQPVAGRLFTAADDKRGCEGIAVLGHTFWQNEYAGAPAAVGQAIKLDGKPFQIVGVLAPGFNGPEVGREPQVYAPLCADRYLRGEQSSLDHRSNWWLRVIGRRHPSVSTEEARSRIKAIATASYEATVPPRWAAADKADYVKRTLGVREASRGMSGIRDTYSKALIVLMGTVAILLLVACANVANLLLARAAARQREVAIRLAIGAARRRLVRQLLTESAILAGLGAVGGLLLAQWGTRALVSLIATSSSPVALDLALNFRVLGFTALVATVTATLFGLIPAWRGTRISPQAAMKANARGVAEGQARFTIAKSLVVAQVALSLMLLVGAGLMIGSLRNLTTLDPGFRSDGVLIVSADFRRTVSTPEQRATTRLALLERFRSTPGVRSASTAELTPLGRSSWNDFVYVDGYTPKEPNDAVVWFNEVSDGFFTTLGTRLLAGRDFGQADVPGSPKVAVMNEAAATKYFGTDSPLGKVFRTKSGDTFSDPVTVVGIVETAKYQNLRESNSATIYLASSQNSTGPSFITMQLRTDGDPVALAPLVKNVFGALDPAISLSLTPLARQVSSSLQRERMLAVLSGVFGAVALALAMLGLYGVMAYTVARRRNEIGVRIALGANRPRVLRMVLADVIRVVAIGVVIGAGAALASGKLVTSFLYGLEPAEPMVLGLAAVILGAVALTAGLVPAWRASRVDPVTALRED